MSSVQTAATLTFLLPRLVLAGKQPPHKGNRPPDRGGGRVHHEGSRRWLHAAAAAVAVHSGGCDCHRCSDAADNAAPTDRRGVCTATGGRAQRARLLDVEV